DGKSDGDGKDDDGKSGNGGEDDDGISDGSSGWWCSSPSVHGCSVAKWHRDLLSWSKGKGRASSHHQSPVDSGGAGLTGKVVISSSESDMMTNGMSTPARGVVAGKGVGRGVVIVL
ncbi:hypothetical protein Tco_1071421, partial [Tanacetum coccineum]